MLSILKILEPKNSDRLQEAFPLVIQAGGHLYIRPKQDGEIIAKIGYGADPKNPEKQLVHAVILRKETGSSAPVDEQRFYISQYLDQDYMYGQDINGWRWTLPTNGEPAVTPTPDLSPLVDALIEYVRFWAD